MTRDGKEMDGDSTSNPHDERESALDLTHDAETEPKKSKRQQKKERRRNPFGDKPSTHSEGWSSSDDFRRDLAAKIKMFKRTDRPVTVSKPTKSHEEFMAEIAADAAAATTRIEAAKAEKIRLRQEDPISEVKSLVQKGKIGALERFLESNNHILSRLIAAITIDDINECGGKEEKHHYTYDDDGIPTGDLSTGPYKGVSLRCLEVINAKRSILGLDPLATPKFSNDAVLIKSLLQKFEASPDLLAETQLDDAHGTCTFKFAKDADLIQLNDLLDRIESERLSCFLIPAPVGPSITIIMNRIALEDWLESKEERPGPPF